MERQSRMARDWDAARTVVAAPASYTWQGVRQVLLVLPPARRSRMDHGSDAVHTLVAGPLRRKLRDEVQESACQTVH
jgi:hypothetical protein